MIIVLSMNIVMYSYSEMFIVLEEKSGFIE